MTCTVSGILRDATGTALPDRLVVFEPQRSAASFSGGASLPDPVKVTTDATGALSVVLLPGHYRARASSGGNVLHFSIVAPDHPTATIADVMVDFPVELAPRLLGQVLAARDATLVARDASEEFADEAEFWAGEAAAAAGGGGGGESTIFTSRAAFEAATVPALLPTWTVMHAGLALRYVNDATGTAIESANGVKGSPAGIARPEHWGAVRDGVTNDGPAINAAIAWAQRVLLTAGTYQTTESVRVFNSELVGTNPGTNALDLICEIRGGAALDVAHPVLSLERSGVIRGVRASYSDDAITGMETAGQRVGVGLFPGGLVAQRGSGLYNVKVFDTGTGVGNIGFSSTVMGLEIVNSTWAYWDNVGNSNGTGCFVADVYMTTTADKRPTIRPTYGFREVGSYGGFYGQINVEHTTFKEAAVHIERRPSASFASLHLEGVFMDGPGKRFVWHDAGQVDHTNLTIINCGLEQENTALIELADADMYTRINPGRNGSKWSTFTVRNLALAGLNDPNVGLYPDWPHPKGLNNAGAGFKFIRRAAGFTDKRYRVEIENIGDLAYPSIPNSVPEEQIHRRLGTAPYTDVDRINLVRFGMEGSGIPARKNFIRNGRFDVWQDETGTYTGSGTTETAVGWWVAPAGGTVLVQKIANPVGSPSPFHMRIANTGTAAVNQTVITRNITEWRELAAGEGNSLFLSYDAKTVAASDNIAQIFITVVSAAGATLLSSQVISGDNKGLAWHKFGEWCRYSVEIPGFDLSSIDPITDVAEIRVGFGLVGGATLREMDFELRNVKLERGFEATAWSPHPADNLPLAIGENKVLGVERLSFRTWQLITDAPAGVITTDRSLVNSNIVAGATITDIVATYRNDDMPFVVIRNQVAAPLVIQHNATIRLAGGANISLAQDESIMLMRAPSNRWQMVGKLGGAGSPDTGAQIRDKLETLTGADRLDASAIQNLPGALTAQTAAVYVSKVGNDTNDGLAVSSPKLTITSSITAAAGLIAGGAPGVLIDVVDGGTYTEAFSVAANMHLRAPAATVVGAITLATGGSVVIDKHYASATSEVMLTKTGAGAASYRANLSDGRGTGGAFTLTNNIQASTTDSILFAEVGVMTVAQFGRGIREFAAGFGHVHFLIKDLYFGANTSFGLDAGAASNLLGFIDHILPLAGVTGTEAITVASGGVVNLTCGSIEATVAYNVAAGGDLYLSCPRIVGTRTGTPANLMLGTADDVVIGDGITDIVRITQAAYDLLAPPDADTLYVIVG